MIARVLAGERAVVILNLVVLWVWSTIWRPLEALRSAALLVAGGDLALRVPVTTHSQVRAPPSLVHVPG